MTRQELELKAKEFDSKIKRHPMSSEELQKVLCDFVQALRIHDVVGQSEQLPCDECVDGQKWSPYYAKYVECDCRK
jgi:hypothetical protein